MQMLNKPVVVEKLRAFMTYVSKNDGKIGIKQRGIDMNLNNACNLRCKHCFTNSPKGDHVKDQLPVEKIAEIADQAHDLGIFEWDLQGGELLLRPHVLFDALAAIKTERFYMYLTTNGTNLDRDMADRLAKAGIDRVSVSIDSINPESHDSFRGKEGAWMQAMEALKNVKAAGMSPYLNITVGHFNAFSEDVEALCAYSHEQGYTTLLNVATPGGMWHQMDEIMCDAQDTAHLIELRKKYKNILRNLWNPFDRAHEAVLGCNTVNRLYVTPLGDVLPCPYVHIKIGNVFEQSLKEISEFGFSISHFRDYKPLCLAGEDPAFGQTFLRSDGVSIFNPLDARTLFPPEDRVEPPVLPKGGARIVTPPQDAAG